MQSRNNPNSGEWGDISSKMNDETWIYNILYIEAKEGKVFVGVGAGMFKAVQRVWKKGLTETQEMNSEVTLLTVHSLSPII
jgi:hypothetical protein